MNELIYLLMKLTDLFTFGKHKGRSLLAVWQGADTDEETTIKHFLQEHFNFISGRIDRTGIKIPSSDTTFEKLQYEMRIINEQKPSHKTTVVGRYLITEADPKYQKTLQKLYIEMLTASFQRMQKTVFLGKPIGGEMHFTSVSQRFMQLNADVGYMVWAIENVDDFYIEPDDLSQLLQTEARRFLHFDVTPVRDDLLEYQPVFSKWKPVLQEDIIAKNRQKAARYRHNVSAYHYDEGREYETYDNYHGTYAQDVEGLSDQFIDEALGGEPDAYWNID